tara:strand:+ start:14062 stop:14442 length:381 start_codon:yes stop_codon:yes gene_type:complete
MELQEMRAQLEEWMELMKHGYRDSMMYMELDYDSYIAGRIFMKLYTDTNCYNISAVPDRPAENSYLGCTVSSRKPRAGEDWTRGSDLADGEFSQDTWFRILSDIVGYELVKIHRPISNLRRVEKVR